VGSEKEWSVISASAFHTVAIKKDGSLWAWGDNSNGELGTGDTQPRTSPVTIEITVRWKQVVAGFNHTTAIKEDGTLWVWGNNFSGELGLGYTGGNQLKPVQSGRDHNWATISLGYTHTLAVKSDGSQWVWGGNEYGQLGTGSLAVANQPVRMEGGIEWANK
jgi:trimeric autotransporter adhesin